MSPTIRSPAEPELRGSGRGRHAGALAQSTVSVASVSTLRALARPAQDSAPGRPRPHVAVTGAVARGLAVRQQQQVIAARATPAERRPRWWDGCRRLAGGRRADGGDPRRARGGGSRGAGRRFGAASRRRPARCEAEPAVAGRDMGPGLPAPPRRGDHGQARGSSGQPSSCAPSPRSDASTPRTCLGHRDRARSFPTPSSVAMLVLELSKPSASASPRPATDADRLRDSLAATTPCGTSSTSRCTPTSGVRASPAPLLDDLLGAWGGRPVHARGARVERGRDRPLRRDRVPSRRAPAPLLPGQRRGRGGMWRHPAVGPARRRPPGGVACGSGSREAASARNPT